MKEQIGYSTTDTCNELRTLRNCNNTFIFSSTTNEEISTIIRNLSSSKSPGHDKLSPKIFINLNNEMNNEIKISKIVPILKAINAHEEDMYRPIALLSIMDKIFEKLIHQQFPTYLENNKLLYDC